MNSSRYDEMMDEILKKEAQRIFNNLLNMYKKGINPNCCFYSLIEKNISNDLEFYKIDIINQVIKLIPIDLIVSLDNYHVFMTTEEEKDYLEKEKNKKLKDIEQLKQEAITIANEIIKNYSDVNEESLLDIFLNYIPNTYNYEQNDWIRKRVVTYIEEYGYITINISPFRLKLK